MYLNTNIWTLEGSKSELVMKRYRLLSMRLFIMLPAEFRNLLSPKNIASHFFLIDQNMIFWEVVINILLLNKLANLLICSTFKSRKLRLVMSQNAIILHGAFFYIRLFINTFAHITKRLKLWKWSWS